MIAAACKAKEAQVWKDVDGILTADPRIVKNARLVKEVSYEEASELAYFGAQVLHPRSMLPCVITGTPVMVKNSYNASSPGTKIGPYKPQNSTASAPKRQLVHAITTRLNLTLVDIVSTRMLGQYGFLAEVFSAFDRHKLSIDMIATSEVSLSLTLDTTQELEILKKEIDKIADMEIKKGKAIVSIIGSVRRSAEVLSRAFSTCQKIGVQVQMVSQGASKVNIGFIVDDTDAAKVVKALHEEFFKEGEK
jgi:aspartate kinase